MLPSSSKGLFIQFNAPDDFKEHEALYEAFHERVTPQCPANLNGDWGDPARVRDYGLLYLQVLLHRSISLIRASHLALADKNIYALALCARGHFESTGALGYIHSRLKSLQNKTIGLGAVDKDLSEMILGSRDKTLSRAPQAAQILNLMDDLDKTVSKHIFQEMTKPQKHLRDCYEFLSEFCHPNFHSNFVAIEIDKSSNLFKLRYDCDPRPEEFHLINYLLLSAPIFITLFDSSREILNTIVPPTSPGD